jgi:thioester reductase-like protein
MAPASRGEVDMTPVDYVARAIVSLSRARTSIGRAYHLLNPQPVAVAELYDGIRSFGFDLQEVPFGQWRSQVIERGAGSQDDLLAGLAQLLHLAAAEDLDATEESRPPARITCNETLKDLAPAGVACPAIDAGMLSRYLQFLVRKGVLPSPRRSDP